MKKENQNGWGGARKGAGRPKNDSKHYQFVVGGEMAKAIDAQANKSEFIKQCIELGMAEMRKRNDEVNPLAYLEGVIDAPGVTFYNPERVQAIEVPLAESSVAAGIPIGRVNESYAEPVDIHSLIMSDRSRCVLMRVKGDSMIDADIYSGDTVGIDTSYETVPYHKIALCELNGEYTIKHVKRESDGSITLIPRNETFSPIHVTAEDDFHVRGMVTGLIRAL